MERVEGIEPSALAWKAKVLPLYDTRKFGGQGKESNLHTAFPHIVSLRRRPDPLAPAQIWWTMWESNPPTTACKAVKNFSSIMAHILYTYPSVISKSSAQLALAEEFRWGLTSSSACLFLFLFLCSGAADRTRTCKPVRAQRSQRCMFTKISSQRRY